MVAPVRLYPHFEQDIPVPDTFRFICELGGSGGKPCAPGAGAVGCWVPNVPGEAADCTKGAGGAGGTGGGTADVSEGAGDDAPVNPDGCGNAFP